MRVCEYNVKEGVAAWKTRAALGCTAEAEHGSRYCPAHRGGLAIIAKPKTRVKHDPNFDVLPWSETDSAALNRGERKRRVKQER